MASMAFDGRAPASSSEIALPPVISPILQTASETLVNLVVSGGEILVSTMTDEAAEIVCRWGEAEPIVYSFFRRTGADPLLADGEEEVGVILDDEAIRLRDF